MDSYLEFKIISTAESKEIIMKHVLECLLRMYQCNDSYDISETAGSTSMQIKRKE